MTTALQMLQDQTNWNKPPLKTVSDTLPTVKDCTQVSIYSAGRDSKLAKFVSESHPERIASEYDVYNKKIETCSRD